MNNFYIVSAVLLVGAGIYSMRPRGIRNNNPLNIKHNTLNKWTGQTGTDKNGFIVFDSAEYGIRAAAKLILNYNSLYGINTITGIINRWAPPTENDTLSYILHVQSYLGINKDISLNLNDTNLLGRLIDVMIQHENGVNPYSVNTIKRGIELI